MSRTRQENKKPPGKRILDKRPLRRRSSYTPGGILVSRWTRIRFYMVGALLSLCFVGVGYKAYGIQVVDQDHYRKAADRQHLRTIEVPAPRGNIYDRKGVELAVNADVDSVFANPRAIVDVTRTSEQLARVLGISIRTLETRLASRRYFTWIKRHVTPTEAQQIRELKLPGVSLAQEPRRYYPGKQLAGHVLGFAGIDGKGLDGLELAMDSVLTGKQAKVAALRDASGRIMIDDPSASPEAGASITLTIDRAIQFATERAIKKAVEVNKAKSAVAVVIDVETGDVLAIASYPDINPNAPGQRVKGARNRALTDTYEVGSVMKVFTVATALDKGVVSPSTVIDTEKGNYKVGRKRYRDSFHDEELSIGDILKRSSNIGALKIARLLGARSLHAGFRKFGFGQKTGIELPGEASGVMHPPQKWGELGLNSHSFGYGMTSTPLQVTAAMAAIGNKGIYFEPRIISRVESGTGKILYQREAQGRRVLSERTTKQLAPMLESVFSAGKVHGTARGLYVPGHRVGGKTGTSHKVDPKTHKYGDNYLSSFSGLAPINNPRIAVTVLIDEPHGEEHYGGKVAGPAWTQIVTEALSVLSVPADAKVLEAQEATKLRLARRFAWRTGIDPDKIERQRRRNEVPLMNEGADQDESDTLATPEIVEQEPGELFLTIGAPGVILIPDFTGMGLAKTLATARSLNIDVHLNGSGAAIDQSPAPGLVRNPGTVEVTFTTSEHAFAAR